MNVINHRKFQKSSGGLSKGLVRACRVLGVLLGLFIIVNIGTAFIYSNKAMPNETVGGRDISGASYTDVERLVNAYTLPGTITLRKDGHTESVPLSQFNISINTNKTMDEVRAKPLLPFFAFFEKRRVPLVLEANAGDIAAKILILDASFSRAATDRRVAFDGNAFIVEDAKGGYTFDADTTAHTILASLAQGGQTVAVATQVTPAGDNSGTYNKERDALNKKLDIKISYKVGGQIIQMTKKDIGGLFEQSGRTMTPSDAAITTYITSVTSKLAVQPSNTSDAVIATQYAIEKTQDMTFALTGANARVLSYCTVADGVPQNELGDLVGKLAVTYGDPRGWNDNGTIAFRHVESGCDYKVVLAAPSQMTSYGTICDNYYNCQVGNSVIINNDRWLYATDPWNKTGQTLETYRLLIINHETGHRLGLRDYNVCSGAGNPAPVMMQQSIDLMGCSFNVWPLQSELDRL